MNLPPEPDDPELIERMQAGMEYVSRDIVALLRYQGFGGTQADKDAASSWLGRRALVPAQERIFVSPGAHPALLGILTILARPGDVVLCEALTYPESDRSRRNLACSWSVCRWMPKALKPMPLPRPARI